jgi:hypothetical protein
MEDALERIHYAVDRFASMARAGFAFAVMMFAESIAPARADKLVPLERVKLTAAESRALSIAKRERMSVFAGWREFPST